MSALYHFSGGPKISVSAPHRARTSNRDEAYVWAIDEWHAPMSFFPWDCPRVLLAGSGHIADRLRPLVCDRPRAGGNRFRR
jgi:hypothetical protein